METPHVCVCGTAASQPYVTGYVGPVPANVFLDTGAAVSLIKVNYLNNLDECEFIKEIKGTLPRISDVNGKTIQVFGKYLLKLSLAGEEMEIPVLAVEGILRFNADILLGVDAMRSYGMTINFKKNMLVSKKQSLDLNYTSIKEVLDRNINTLLRNNVGRGCKGKPPLHEEV